MIREFNNLTRIQQDTVRVMVAQARRSRGLKERTLSDGCGAYAYQGESLETGPNGRIHWGFNNSDGLNIATGVVEPGEALP